MKATAAFLLPRATCLAALLLWAVAVPAQSPAFLLITPDKATMLIGESRTFRLVDPNGHMQRHVSWNISDRGSFQADEGDELVITAKRAGDFRISARSPDGSADATVKVMEGTTLPLGTVKWSAGTIPGCKTTKIIPAVPSASGTDVFEQSECEDGAYLAANAADGIQLWRRKIGGAGTPATELAKSAAVAGRLNLRSPSICDSLSEGTGQQNIRELLTQRNLSFSEGSPGERVWIVEESGTQCKLWFDDNSVLTKKRKILVSE